MRKKERILTHMEKNENFVNEDVIAEVLIDVRNVLVKINDNLLEIFIKINNK